MINKIFFDTNIIIDIIADRPNAKYARRILAYSAMGSSTRIYASYLSIADAAYILRKKPLAETKKLLSGLMSYFDVLPSNDIQITDAIKNECPDFEDALQIACAESKQCDVILTWNTVHFRRYTEIPVLSPEEFVNACR